MDQFSIAYITPRDQNINDVISKEATTVNFFRRKEIVSNYNPDIGVLVKTGMVKLVFPSGKHRNDGSGCDDDDAVNGVGGYERGGSTDSFEDKLREFLHYQPMQLYQGRLAPERIHLTSPEGKAMFREALESPYMEAYFTVSPQVNNQPEYTCSSTSLVVALNALGIDPGRPTFYGECRWHHLGSLACCTRQLQNPNLTLDQFSCLAVCNDTRAFPVRVTDDWTPDLLRAWIKMAAGRTDMVMVMNCGRKEMKQNGIGHFMPLTGYHEGSDMVLVIDVAKHKYPPQWIPLDLMLKALQARDDRTGLNRGFVLLMCPDYEPSERMFGTSLLFRLDEIPGKVDNRLTSFMDQWNRFLNTQVDVDMSCEDIIKMAIHNFLSVITWDDMESAFSMLDMTLVYFRSDRGECPSIVARCRRPQCPESCPNSDICQQLQTMNTFKHVHTYLKTQTKELRQKCLDLVVGQLPDIDHAVLFAKATSQNHVSMQTTVQFFEDLYSKSQYQIKGFSKSPIEIRPHRCPGYVEFFPEHIATLVLMLWPYVVGNDNLLGQKAFLPLLKEYNLPSVHINNITSEMPKHSKNSIQGSHSQGSQLHHNTDSQDKMSLRDHLTRIVNEDLEKSESRILQEQVRGLNIKLSVVLKYHHLM